MTVVNHRGATQGICFSILLLLAFLPERSVGSAPASASQTQALVASQAPTETFFGGYRTVEGMQSFLDRQVSTHPTLAEKVDFGDSWCKAHPGQCTIPDAWAGYDMWALRITNRAIGGTKPVFWLDAGIHGHEIVPPEVALRFITWLLDSYNTNADARWLIDYHDIWVVPMANPDGHHMGQAGGNQPYPQRKNADRDDGCTAFPPTAENRYAMLGVDLNRNFPFKWDCCEGGSNDPCSQLYRGPSAGSEEETQAIVGLLRRLIPDQRGPGDTDAAPLTATGVVLSLHTFGRVNMHPWSYSDNPAPNQNDLGTIVRHMGAPETGGNGYLSCQSGGPEACPGGAVGSTFDWAYGELGAASVLTELESEGRTFTPPYSDVDVIWNRNRNALLYLAKIARTPYLLARGPDANNLAVEPRVVNAGSSPRIAATINSLFQGNYYADDIGGAEYYIDIPPWAGGTPKPLTPIDGSFDSLTEAVQGAVDTTGLSAGKHIIFVRGRHKRDYDGHQSWGPISAIFVEVVQSGGTPVPTAVSSPTAVTRTRTPIGPPVALPGSGSRTFPETNKTVSGVFLDYWTRNGGLAQQGYPISEVIGEVSDLDGKAYTMQYFERAVFEYHPEHAGTPYQVLLSQLGTFRYRQKYPNGAPSQTPNTSPGSMLFPETGKRLGGIFLDYWKRNGGLAQQGYPISDEFMEKSDLNGQTYKVQYFERSVFELHPENAGTPYEVLLSQLGTFRYRAQYP